MPEIRSKHQHDNLAHEMPMDGNARVATAANGVPVATRRKINVASADGTVTVTGTDDASGEEVILDLSTNPSTGPLVASLTVTPTAFVFPTSVTANASGSTDGVPIRTYAWNWGDGNTTAAGPSATATHTYTTAGTYNVVVTVTDANNATATATKTVVSSAPAASGTDLVITALSFTGHGADPAHPIAGDLVDFSVTVQNAGSVAVPAGRAVGQNIGVGIYLDGATAPVTFTNYDGGLAGGASFTQDTASGWSHGVPWTATNGAHTIMAWVDDAGQITELNNSNNQMTIALTIVPAPAVSQVIDHGSVNAITAGTTLDSATFTPAAGSLLVVVTEGTTI